MVRLVGVFFKAKQDMQYVLQCEMLDVQHNVMIKICYLLSDYVVYMSFFSFSIESTTRGPGY